MNSMPPSDLGDFLRRPNIVDNDTEICLIYNNYIQTPTFLETVCPRTKRHNKTRYLNDLIIDRIIAVFPL